MLFSNDSVARLMNELYECAWESVRPVPRVEIDFGDGRRLTRTLQGNVATYLCTPDGRVADIVPGLATPEMYRERLVAGAELARRDARFLAEYHREMERGVTPERIGELRDFEDKTKRGIEGRLKRSLADTLESTLGADEKKRAVERPVDGSLRDDASYNATVRMPKIHKLLADKALATPAELKVGLFRDILGYDIEDPWLGLAPVVLGGEGGRHE